MDIQRIQRVRSSGAALNRHAFEIAASFWTRFMAACPHLHGTFGRTGKSRLRATAAQWGWMVKNAGRLETIEGELAFFGKTVAGRGVGPNEIRAAKTALLESMRHAAGFAWTPDVGSDWSVFLDEVQTLVSTQEPAVFAQAA
jgi:hemoglobin-like flavoprotein